MAFSQIIPLPTGNIATYHIIQRLDMYPNDGVIDVTINGYISAVAYSNGDMQSYTWSKCITYSALGENVTDPTQAQIYSYLLTLSNWQGAQSIENATISAKQV